MRPSRLELSGFTTFRDLVEIDFEGAEIFALTGATGSGKSSVIDAICFALYGCVPRYGDRRLVAPAISQGRVEARVRLDFSVAGAHYTAVRIVRRTKTGATTPEARLERAEPGDGDNEVLASGADEVTAAVEALLGLTFEHFTTCVVLPQGDFARFLHDKARDRQQLLAKLLELTVYDEMGRAARQRAKEATNRRELLDDQLARVAFATPEARRATEARIVELAALKDAVERDLARIDELASAAAVSRREAGDAMARAVLLEGLTVPPGIADLAEQLTTAAAEREAAAAAAVEAEAALRAAEEAEAALAPAGELERARDAHAERAAVAARMAKGEDALMAATAAGTAAEEALARAERSEEKVRREVEHVRLQHRAHSVAAELVAGEPCPVCRQRVDDLPPVEPLPDLDRALEDAAAAARAVEAGRAAVRAAAAEQARVEEKVLAVRARMAELDAAVAAHPDPAAVAAALETLSAARQAVLAAREDDRRARERARAADAAVDALRRREDEARRSFDAARDTVAALAPPPAARVDLAADWRELVGWAAAAAPEQRRVADAAASAAEVADGQARELRDRTVGACAGAGVTTAGNLRDGCVDALLRAEGELASIDKALAERQELSTECGRLREVEQVAATLGRHLDAKGFEKWVLDEALDELVAGATGLLRELSGGQYSLAVDAKTSNFAVVDHRNADEVRSARTLSGGETFLASLALALSLAEMTARGAAQLDAIFLDEGFGTLDPDTLDTVAAAIEELGARGRMVGLVSHVRELAERVPVRFEVRKGPSSSTVEKIVA